MATYFEDTVQAVEVYNPLSPDNHGLQAQIYVQSEEDPHNFDELCFYDLSRDEIYDPVAFASACDFFNCDGPTLIEKIRNTPIVIGYDINPVN